MELAVDSKGNVIQLSDNEKQVNLYSPDARQQKLSELVQSMSIDNSHCRYIAQDGNAKEYIVYFVKTPLESSSETVKLANELDKHPEILANEDKTNFLKSVVSSQENGGLKWYVLHLGYVWLERNVYDSQYICGELVRPVPLHKLRSFVNITNEEALSCAMERKEYAMFSEAITEKIDAISRTGCESDSNFANWYIQSSTNDHHNWYAVYAQVKKCIKKAYKNTAYGIVYKGNRISATINGIKIVIFCCGTEKEPMFLMGGRVISGIDAFNAELSSLDFFEEKQWYSRVKNLLVNNSN